MLEQKPSEYSIDDANAEFPLKQTIRLIKKPEEPEVEEEAQDEPMDEKEQEIQERAIQKKRRRKWRKFY